MRLSNGKMGERVDAVILAGGQGRRLAGVLDDLPKPMAPVGEQPFLDYLLAALAASRVVKRAILGVGHLAEVVESRYERHEAPLPITYSRERAPLGTGGAIVKAMAMVEGDHCLALNGDSYVVMDIPAFLAAHRKSGAEVTVALVEQPETRRFGRVECSDGAVTAFREKSAASGPGLINAGVYAVRKTALAGFPEGPLSFEYDVLPSLLGRRLHGIVVPGPFIDIGLPETLGAARTFFESLRSNDLLPLRD